MVIAPWPLGQGFLVLEQVFSESDSELSFRDALGEILSSWFGLIEINLNLDESLLGKIEGANLGQIVLDAVRECITNAARHGAATKINLDFSETAAGVQLIAKNQGRYPNKKFEPGLGWQTMVAAAKVAEQSSDSGEFQIKLVWGLREK